MFARADRADNGRFRTMNRVSPHSLTRREGRSLRPPYFLEGSLSGIDNGRGRLFKAQSGLSWLGENAISPTNLGVILRSPPRIAIRADNRRFTFSLLILNLKDHQNIQGMMHAEKRDSARPAQSRNRAPTPKTRSESVPDMRCV